MTTRTMHKRLCAVVLAIAVAGLGATAGAYAAEAAPSVKLAAVNDKNIVVASLKGFPPQAEIQVKATVSGGSGTATAKASSTGRSLLAFSLPNNFVGVVTVAASSGAAAATSSTEVGVATPDLSTTTTIAKPLVDQKPGPSNTGVTTGTALSVVTGHLNVTQAGLVIEGKDIHGTVTINAANVVIRNSIIRGTDDGSNPGARLLRVQSGSVTVENSEIFPTKASVSLDCVGAKDFTGRRLDIHGCVDGLKLGSNSRLESSWVHDLAWYASDPAQGGTPTHNDAVQVLSGSNVVLQGNYLDVRGEKQMNAAIQVTQDVGPVTGFRAVGNWADGGGCTFNFAHKGGESLQVDVSGNRFGRSSKFGCPMILSTQTTLSGTGNVWDDTGAAVPINRHD